MSDLKFAKPSNGTIKAIVSGALEGVKGVSGTVVSNITTAILNEWETHVAGYRTEAQTAIDAMQRKLDAAQKEVDGFVETYNNEQESYKAKYEAELPALQDKYDKEVAAHAAFRTETENASKNATVDKLYTDVLTTAGLRPDLIANELKLANRELLALDDKGVALKDAAKALADAKTRWTTDDFAVETRGGAKTFQSGPLGDAKAFPEVASGTGGNKAMNAFIRAGANVAETE